MLKADTGPQAMAPPGLELRGSETSQKGLLQGCPCSALGLWGRNPQCPRRPGCSSHTWTMGWTEVRP